MRRRELLPWWIKLFIIFLAFAIVSNLVAIGFYLKGLKPNLVVFGFNADNNYPYVLLLVSAIFFMNFISAVLLWFEKDNAIKFAIANSILGIVLCIVSFVMDIYNGNFNFRFEIIPLIIFVYYMKKINSEWKNLKPHDVDLESA
ncbi:MAG: hypothetical protein M0D53_04580 [Flavobacterium sp. JAD_PAG50586_2]|nr:MAG: hypothetical protein M0D53_04580 [Flavobacterium sp. JAD_PAG50586_2]